jgi:hypothetical protein
VTRLPPDNGAKNERADKRAARLRATRNRVNRLRRQQKALRRTILTLHARLDPRGGVILCQPSPAELAREATAHRGNDGKPVYDTRSAAKACAKELAEAGVGRLVPYLCPRGKHYHLASPTTVEAVRVRAPADVVLETTKPAP